MESHFVVDSSGQDQLLVKELDYDVIVRHDQQRPTRRTAAMQISLEKVKQFIDKDPSDTKTEAHALVIRDESIAAVKLWMDVFHHGTPDADSKLDIRDVWRVIHFGQRYLKARKTGLELDRESREYKIQPPKDMSILRSWFEKWVQDWFLHNKSSADDMTNEEMLQMLTPAYWFDCPEIIHAITRMLAYKTVFNLENKNPTKVRDAYMKGVPYPILSQIQAAQSSLRKRIQENLTCIPKQNVTCDEEECMKVFQFSFIKALVKKFHLVVVEIGTTANSTTPNGTATNGTTPNGTTPNGTTPNGTTPNGTTPNIRTPNGAAMIGATTANDTTSLDGTVTDGTTMYDTTSIHSSANGTAAHGGGRDSHEADDQREGGTEHVVARPTASNDPTPNAPQERPRYASHICSDCKGKETGEQDSTSYNLALVVSRTVADIHSRFQGLCLDCMHKFKEGGGDWDYWRHNKIQQWDKGCRIRHGQPSWYFSFMGRVDETRSEDTPSEMMEKLRLNGASNGSWSALVYQDKMLPRVSKYAIYRLVRTPRRVRPSQADSAQVLGIAVSIAVDLAIAKASANSPSPSRWLEWRALSMSTLELLACEEGGPMAGVRGDLVLQPTGSGALTTGSTLRGPYSEVLVCSWKGPDARLFLDEGVVAGFELPRMDMDESIALELRGWAGPLESLLLTAMLCIGETDD
ncbi:Uu.00g001450.m01.CDS01 [Anthostomella pinea]|uniref:Uu.00g001450.m01.CDS01 n=1 Tax=Anthostomella pinea TaxID=933095 RepID=A0AAI8YIE8_9PEZI|nr:Uu.00g001450.m01.CDS01 [Anthostomella pinea]